MKVFVAAAMVAASLFVSSLANATQFNVRIVNLTNGIWYTPFLVVAHPDGSSLFTVGQPASASLQAMAEAGGAAFFRVRRRAGNFSKRR